MKESPRCVGFTYDDAASVLSGLDFEQIDLGGGSHRRWARLLPDGRRPIVGLVQGHGDVKPVYIRTMLKTLRDYGLIDGERE